MRFYYILTTPGGVVEADARWVINVYAPSACANCGDVLPRNAGPINVDIVQETENPFAVVAFKNIALLRTDLLDSMRADMQEFFFGSVRVLGRPMTSYVSVFADEAARLREYGGARAEYVSCPQCGRTIRHVVAGNTWYSRRDIGDRLVFSDIRGVGLYVAESLVEGLGAPLRRELSLFAIDVRD